MNYPPQPRTRLYNTYNVGEKNRLPFMFCRKSNRHSRHEPAAGTAATEADPAFGCALRPDPGPPDVDLFGTYNACELVFFALLPAAAVEDPTFCAAVLPPEAPPPFPCLPGLPFPCTAVPVGLLVGVEVGATVPLTVTL